MKLLRTPVYKKSPRPSIHLSIDIDNDNSDIDNSIFKKIKDIFKALLRKCLTGV